MSSLHETPVDVLGQLSHYPDLPLPRLSAMDASHYESAHLFYPPADADALHHHPPPAVHHAQQHPQHQHQQHHPHHSHQQHQQQQHHLMLPPPPLDQPQQQQQQQQHHYSTPDYQHAAHSAYPPQQPRPALNRAPTAPYDDMFSDIQSTFDQTHVLESVTQPDAPSLEGDSKLLSFAAPTYPYTLLDYTYRRTSVALNAHLHGMFFLSESAYQNGEPTSPIELTCYRRNLFSISGSISIPRSLRYILTESGEQIPIVAQELSLSATESVEGNQVKIISVPWKTPAGAQPAADERHEKEPPSIPLDLMAGAELDPEVATLPIQWKRLQFRIATANNGRRKELQQHFVIKLKVVASLSTGQRVPLAEILSNHVIVRGRSPRNFQSKKEFPVGQSTSGRKSHASKSSISTTAAPAEPTPVKTDGPFMFDPADLQMSPDFLDWKVPQSTPSTASLSALPADTFTMPPGVNLYASASPGFQRKPSPPRPSKAINLSLMDEEPHRADHSDTSAGPRPRKMAKLTSPTNSARVATSYSAGSFPESEDSAEQTYEYFPLGMDDWQEPVDAVYRPHVVHHVNMPSDVKSGPKRKRYFSSEEQS